MIKKNHQVLKNKNKQTKVCTHIHDPALFHKTPPLFFALLCYKPRAEDASARLAQQGGMVPSHAAECGLAVYGRAGITVRAVGFALPWLSLALIGAYSEITVKNQLTYDTRTGQ